VYGSHAVGLGRREAEIQCESTEDGADARLIPDLAADVVLDQRSSLEYGPEPIGGVFLRTPPATSDVRDGRCVGRIWRAI
jgi:hypothetical protein